MVEPRIVADRDDQRVVDLIGLRAIGGDVAFDQRRAGVLAEAQQRAREHRRRRGAAGDMNDLQRLRQHDAIGDLDHHAVGHHRGVERDHRIGAVGREQLRLQRWRRRLPARRAGVRMASPFSSRRCGKLRREHAVHQHQPARALDRLQLHGRGGRASARRVRRGAPAAALRASARADRCISSPRSGGAAGRRARKPRSAAGAPRRPCRCPAAGRARRQSVAQRASGFGLCQCNVHHDRSRVRPRLRTGRSRTLRAPAPAPCRRSSRTRPFDITCTKSGTM